MYYLHIHRLLLNHLQRLLVLSNYFLFPAGCGEANVVSTEIAKPFLSPFLAVALSTSPDSISSRSDIQFCVCVDEVVTRVFEVLKLSRQPD